MGTVWNRHDGTLKDMKRMAVAERRRLTAAAREGSIGTVYEHRAEMNEAEARAKADRKGGLFTMDEANACHEIEFVPAVSGDGTTSREHTSDRSSTE